MNRQLAIAAIALSLTSLSACKLNDVNRLIPNDYAGTTVVAHVRPGVQATTAPTEGFTPAAVITCEGVNCPTPPPVFYPCVSGTPEGAITEGAGSHICP